MPGSITPLPVMLNEEDRKIYDKLESPKTIVVRYGYQKLIAELPYDGDAKPGCGSKMVIRTDRGTELAEMLTTTCPNSGCGSAVSRKDMLSYIDNSGGKDYPFTKKGKILRVADVDDLNEQAKMDKRKPGMIKLCKGLIAEHGLSMKLVEVEVLLGGERVIFYYASEDRVDFRELVKGLAGDLHTRIEMCQVSAREEARLVADYEKCGQRCCCKQFLKVLKPVSMKSAKIQKATLDPQKISGRCGRLMCCLRYEDQTYDALRKNLPNRKSYVETEDGIGWVLDSQILTQLVLVKLGPTPPQAYPLENIRVLTKEEASEHRKMLQEKDRQREERDRARSERRGKSGKGGKGRGGSGSGGGTKEPRRPRPGKPLGDDQVESKEGGNSSGVTDTDAPANENKGGNGSGENAGGTSGGNASGGGGRKRRRRRRGRGGGGKG